MTVKDAIVGFEMDNALFSSGRNNDAVIERNNMAISALKQQTCGGWIPCSERLPEKRGNYLVTVRENDGSLKEDFVMVVKDHYNGKSGDWTSYPTRHGRNGNICEVLAWQPLPEPYKAN